MSTNRTTRDAILTLADVVHAHARNSIHLHNKIKRAQSTLVSAIKSFFGSHVAFEELAQESVQLNDTWKQVLSQVESAEQLLQTTMSAREREYFQLIRRYAESNDAAVALLVERQAAFSKAGESAKRSTLTYAQSKELTRRYDDAVAQCQQLLEELKNASFVFLSPSNA